MNSLSGRFLILTIVFVMLAEVMILVPSIARFREEYLLNRLERAQIATLALLADDMIDMSLEDELLENAEVLNVVMRRDEVRELMLSSEMPQPIHASFDLRDPTALELIRDGFARLVDSEDRIIRVIGEPVRDAGLLIEVTMPTASLRAAMVDYGVRILLLSAVISIITAILLFVAVRGFLVKPIRGVVGHMKSYAAAPEDARRIITPTAGISELREAEDALLALQTELTQSLKQKERLAQLGGAVSKISHDLRNILTTAQLFTDRIEASEDPVVRRMAPKLVGSITRAVNLCESTLAFGKAEEAAPVLNRVNLSSVVQDVLAGERLASAEHEISYSEDISSGMSVRADPEQLYRIIGNLVRNARQAIVATGKPAEILIQAEENAENWIILVADTGPGLPEKAREHLFTAFQGSVRKGGSGLGLSIAQELVRGHGGTLELEKTDERGTTFKICLPKAEQAFEGL